jgi:hypothetical protein
MTERRQAWLVIASTMACQETVDTFRDAICRKCCLEVCSSSIACYPSPHDKDAGLVHIYKYSLIAALAIKALSLSL